MSELNIVRGADGEPEEAVYTERPPGAWVSLPRLLVRHTALAAVFVVAGAALVVAVTHAGASPWWLVGTGVTAAWALDELVRLVDLLRLVGRAKRHLERDWRQASFDVERPR